MKYKKLENSVENETDLKIKQLKMEYAETFEEGYSNLRYI